MDVVLYADAFGSVVDFCWGFGSVSLWYTGIVILGVDKVTVGTLIAFGTYISMFWQPIMNLSNFYNQLITNISGAERILRYWIPNPILPMQRTLLKCRLSRAV